MSINKAIGFVTALAIVGSGIVACSSSDSGSTTTPTTDAGKADTGPVKTPDASTTTPDAATALVCEPPDTLVGYTEPTPYGAPASFGKNVCTPAQITALVAACVKTGGAADCEAFKNGAGNAACFACAVTDINATTGTGPFLTEAGAPYQVTTINDVGCFDHFQAGCGAGLAAWSECVGLTCDSAAGGNCENATDAEFTACLRADVAGVCKTQYNKFSTGCSTALADANSPGQVCNSTQGETQAAYSARLAGYFCGAGVPAATDAGGGG